jgi:hypothetical protein
MNQLFNPTTVRAEYKSILVDGVYCQGAHQIPGVIGKHEKLLATAAHAQYR